jgi:hypothetical protein
MILPRTCLLISAISRGTPAAALPTKVLRDLTEERQLGAAGATVVLRILAPRRQPANLKRPGAVAGLVADLLCLLERQPARLQVGVGHGGCDSGALPQDSPERHFVRGWRLVPVPRWELPLPGPEACLVVPGPLERQQVVAAEDGDVGRDVELEEQHHSDAAPAGRPGLAWDPGSAHPPIVLRSPATAGVDVTSTRYIR